MIWIFNYLGPSRPSAAQAARYVMYEGLNALTQRCALTCQIMCHKNVKYIHKVNCMFFFFNFYLTFWLILSMAWFLSLSLAALYLEFLALLRNIFMRNIWLRVGTWPPLMVGQASYSVPTTCSPSYVARLIQHKYTIQIFTTNTWHRCNRNVFDFYTNFL